MDKPPHSILRRARYCLTRPPYAAPISYALAQFVVAVAEALPLLERALLDAPQRAAVERLRGMLDG